MRSYHLLPNDDFGESTEYPWPIDPIWETPAIQHFYANHHDTFESPRCGGCYAISRKAIYSVRTLRMRKDHRAKARLTSWLIEQRRLGNRCPKITMEAVDRAEQGSNMSILDRADAVLKLIGSKVHKLDKGVIYASRDPKQEIEGFTGEEMFSFFMSGASRRANYYELIAFSESIDYHELSFLLDYLKERKWIKIVDVADEHTEKRVVKLYEDEKTGRIDARRLSHTKSCLLTFEGYARLAEIQETKTDSSRGFMAMWFDQSMDKIWQEGFEPGIRRAGYEPIRIDQKEHVNKIDDEIIAEIRRAKFVVADFTQGETGARGGVYYEAGFAHGLDIPVIFTCQKDCLKKIHFDIRQYNCIIWERDDLKKLQEDLANRITAILGDGPGRSAS